MDDQGHIITITRPGFSLSAAKQYVPWIDLQTGSATSKALIQYMQMKGYQDGFFFYQRQRVWISTVGPEFFDQDRNFYSFKVHAITIYLTRYANVNYSQFFGKVPSQAFDDAWFFPLFSNHFSSGAIYSGNSGKTRTLANSEINLLAINGTSVALANEKFPYDGYEDPIAINFTGAAGSYVLQQEIQGDGLVLVVTNVTLTSITVNFTETNTVLVANPSYTFAAANVPLNTSIYLLLMPSYWCQSTSSVTISLQPSTAVLDRAFTVRTAQAGGSSFLLAGSSLGVNSNLFPFDLRDFRDINLRNAITYELVPVKRPTSASPNVFFLDMVEAVVSPAFLPIQSNPIAPFNNRPSTANVDSQGFSVVYWINGPPNTTFAGSSWGTETERTVNRLASSGAHADTNMRFAMSPFNTLTAISLFSDDTKVERPMMWRTSRSGFWPYGINVDSTLNPNTMMRLVNPDYDKVGVPTLNFNKVTRSGYASSPLCANTQMPKVMASAWFKVGTMDPTAMNAIHSFGDDAFAEGVRVRKIFVDSDAYFSFKGHYCQHTLSIGGLTLSNERVGQFERVVVPFELTTYLRSLGGSQVFNISMHLGGPVLPSYFSRAINDRLPTLHCDLNMNRNRNRFTIATITGGQSQYSPWQFVDKQDFNLYYCWVSNKDKSIFINFFGNGGLLIYHIEQCQ